MRNDRTQSMDLAAPFELDPGAWFRRDRAPVKPHEARPDPDHGQDPRDPGTGDLFEERSAGAPDELGL